MEEAVDTTEESSSRSHDLARKYHLLMELGRGGTAVVSAGLSRGIGGFSKLVVLKEIREEVLGEREAVKMFVNEARLSARMNHPNIVQVYEVFRRRKLPVIVMEYLDGESLAHVQEQLLGTSRYTAEVAVTVLCKVLAGLHYAHTLTDYDGQPLRIVHRDVSPQNVMLTCDGQVKLLDFGIAKLSSAPRDTRTGVVKGKLGYMAPEQFEGTELDGRADVFSVGVMLWEALNHKRLWEARSDAEIVRCLAFGEIPALTESLPGLDPELDRICKRALAADPAERYGSAAAFQAELEHFLAARGAVVQQSQIADLVREGCGAQTRSKQERLQAELAKIAAASPGWNETLQAFDEARTPLPDPPPRTPSGARWAALAGVLGVAALGFVYLRSPARRDLARPAPHAESEAARSAEAPAVVEVKLRVQVTPPGASVYLDGRLLGAAPLAASLPSDSALHELRVEADAHEPWTRPIALESDTYLELTLAAQPMAEEPTAAPARPKQAAARPPRNTRTTAAPTSTAAPPAPRDDENCTPPYQIGSDGIKRFRPECL